MFTDYEISSKCSFNIHISIYTLANIYLRMLMVISGYDFASFTLHSLYKMTSIFISNPS